MSKQLELDVMNVKCAGCAQSIRDGLLPLDGIDTVEVDVASGHVSIDGSDFAEPAIHSKLSELGYPVKDNG